MIINVSSTLNMFFLILILDCKLASFHPWLKTSISIPYMTSLVPVVKSAPICFNTAAS